MSIEKILQECLSKTDRKGNFLLNEYAPGKFILLEEVPVAPPLVGDGTAQAIVLDEATEVTLRDYFKVPVVKATPSNAGGNK